MDQPGAKKNHPVVCIVGPTAVGKSRVAQALAKRFDGAIVNADSMQLFRGLDIGTAKPSLEERSQVPHYMYDVVDVGETMNAGVYAEMASKVIDSIHQQGKPVFVVGGTGLYIRALLNGLCDSGAANLEIRDKINNLEKTHGLTFLYEQLRRCDEPSWQVTAANDAYRIKRALEVFEATGEPASNLRDQHGFQSATYRALKLGMTLDRSVLYQQINARVAQMFATGILEEVDCFAPGSEQGIGYPQARQVKLGAMSLTEAIDQSAKETRRYAKRQWTWFKRDADIHWYDMQANDCLETLNEISSAVQRFLSSTQ